MTKNIFVACDVSSQKEILNLLSEIHNEISGIKIGLQYITRHSPEQIRELGKFNKPIFYDGKFFDIKIIDTKIAGTSTAHNSSRVLLLFTQITPKLSIYT